MIDDQRRAIAVVDDDPAVRDSLRFLLEVMGLTVRTFASGAEFQQAGAHQFACLILDQHMPHMTGLELVGTLRAEGSAIPILLVTGSPSPSIVARAMQLGIEGILEKPPSETHLLDFINRHRS
jgi:FixJ family two-component response regulator